MKLRQYQQDTIQEIRNSLKTGLKRVMVMSPTGSGKTVLAATIVKNASEKGKRTWFICDNVELVEQTIETFEKFGLSVGVIQGIHEKTDYTKQIQVVTAQTITRRWQRFDQNRQWLPDLILIDEAHVVYKSHNEIMRMLPSVPVVAFSATPFTKGLSKIYDSMVVSTTTRELTALNYLSKTVVYGAAMPDLKGVKTKNNGDWQEESLVEKINTKKIVGDIVSTWQRLGENRQTIVFCVNIVHSTVVANAFDDAGVITAHIDGHTNKDMRKQMIAEFKGGEIKVLCSVGVLVKGFDAPNVGCIVMARPTKSLMLHIQMLGRGLRIAEDKKDCIILDHAGNVQRNGFPDDDLPDRLCDGEKGNVNDRKPKDDPLPKPCQKCTYMKPAGLHKCPKCGFEPEKQNDVEVEPGELKLLKANEKRNKIESKEDKQKFYSGLLRVAKDKGYAEGWAANQYRSRYSVWPNAMEKIIAGTYDQNVANFVKSQQIRYAKGRAKRYV